VVAMATSFEGSKKTNHSNSSTNPENLTKIDPVDLDTVGVTKIVKKIK